MYKDQEDSRYGKRGVSVLQGAFELYRNAPHKYNPGQKNYQQLVNKRANEVMQSPEVQQWVKERAMKQSEEFRKYRNRHYVRTPKFDDGKDLKVELYKQKYLDEALQFAEDYRNSPGFNERWKKIGRVGGPTRKINSVYNPLSQYQHKLVFEKGPFKKGNYISWKEDPTNAMYKFGNGDFYIGSSK